MGKARNARARKFASNAVSLTTSPLNAGDQHQRDVAKAKEAKARVRVRNPKVKEKAKKKDLAAKAPARVKVRKMFVVTHVANSDILRRTAQQTPDHK